MEDTEQIETTDRSKPEQHEPGKPKQKRAKNRSPKLQLQICLNTAEELLASPTLKEAKKCDLLISRMSTLHDLMLAQKDEDSETTAKELETLKQERDEKDAQISALEAEVSTWRAKAGERLVQVVPDPRLAESISSGLAKDDLLRNAGEAIRANCDEPTRLRIGASLTKKMSKAAQPLVSEICDWASIFAASQRSTEELEATITRAAPGARGSGIQISKSVLAARGVAIPEVGSFTTRPKYADVFDQADRGEW